MSGRVYIWYAGFFQQVTALNLIAYLAPMLINMAGLRRYEFSLEAEEDKVNMSAKRTDNPFRKKPTSLPRLGLRRAPSPDSY